MDLIFHVDHVHEKLREIVLLQEFKRSMQLDVRRHLEEQRVDMLDKAAINADDYVLTHKNSNKVTVEPINNKKRNWSKIKKTSSSQVKGEIKPQSQQGQATEANSQSRIEPANIDTIQEEYEPLCL